MPVSLGSGATINNGDISMDFGNAAAPLVFGLGTTSVLWSAVTVTRWLQRRARIARRLRWNSPPTLPALAAWGRSGAAL